MSLRADALLATTGIFPTQIGHREHIAAAAVQPTWARRLKTWLTAEQKPFDFVEPKNLDRRFAMLALDPQQSEVASWLEGLGVHDAELMADYYSGLLRARQYMVDAWPKFAVDTISGPKILPLSHDDAAEMWSLIQVLDDPERVLDEIDAHTLTASQAAAFSACYPDLAKFASDTLDSEIATRLGRDRAWEPASEKEQVARILRGQPPEEPFKAPPKPPEAATGLKIEPQNTRTQGEVSSAPKSGDRPTAATAT